MLLFILEFSPYYYQRHLLDFELLLEILMTVKRSSIFFDYFNIFSVTNTTMSAT
jgi:hypothetical protein